MSTAVVGVLRAILTADTAAFDDAMKRAGDAAKEWTKKIGDAGKSAGEQLSDTLGDSVLKLASAFSISHVVDSAIEGIVDFGKSAFTTSAHVYDLSLKLGISTDAIQKYSYVAAQGGTSAEAFGNAVFKLGVNLEKGGKEVEAALHTLGLTSAQLKSLKPEDQFDLVARALGGLTDVQERNRAGVALMGRGYSEIAAAVVEYRDKVDQATVVDADRIKALDETTKAYERLKDTIEKKFTSAVGDVALGWERAQKSGMGYLEMLSRATDGSLGYTVAVREQANEQERLNKLWEKATPFGMAGAKDIDLPKDQVRIYGEELAAAKKEIDGLTASQRKEIDAALQLGEKLDNLKDKYGLSANAVQIYGSYTAELTKKEKEHETELKKTADAAKKAAEELEKAGRAISVAGVNDAIKKMSAELAVAAKNGGLAKDSLEKYGKQIDEWMRQGYKVDATLSDVHYQWVILHATQEDAAAAMKKLVAGAPDIVTAMKAQAAAIDEAATKYGYFAAMANNASANTKALHAIMQGIPGTIVTGDLKKPKAGFGGALGGALAGAVPSLIGTAIGGSLFGGGGLAQGAQGAATQVGGIFAGVVGNSVKGAVMKGATGAASMAATIAGGVASMGISVGVQAAIAGVSAAIAHNKNKTKEAREDFAKQLGFGDLAGLYKDLASISDAGAKLADVGQHVIGKQDQAANEKWMKDVQAFYADIAKKQQAIADDFGKLGTALEVFGGVAPKALHPMIEELMKAPGLTAEMKAALQGLEGEPSWQSLQSRAEALGVSLSALGPAFESAKLTDIALGYARDLDAFRDAGADIPGVLSGMADELSALYQEAAKGGVALPESLQGYMEQLVRMGLLVDENGEKVEDLNKVAFKEIEDKALKDVVDILTQIKDLLASGIPKAAEEGAKDVQRSFFGHPVTIPVKYDVENAPEPGLGLQGGTHGRFVDWGDGTPVTLHGKEAVVPEGEALDASGRPIQITVVSTLDGREVAKNQVKYIPRELTLAGV